MLRIENLSVELGQFSLHSLSLDVPEGDYFFLIGPTGAGKTVLIECVAGLQKPAGGRIYINEAPVNDLPPEARGIGYVPQDYALFPHMDVAANIAYGLVERSLNKDAIDRKTEDIADLLQISHLLQRRPSTLSGGERQRVALARALVLDCKLLLLDEPFGALDQSTKQDLMPYLADIHQKMGLTVLHITHDFSEAFGLASRMGVINSGRLLQIGTVQDVFTRPVSRTIASFVGMANVWSLTPDPVSDCPTTGAFAPLRSRRRSAPVHRDKQTPGIC